MLWCVTLLALLATAQGRVVNISNTWVLPEEGFPVFYRYFRDRISWYEADAVCQFHHANLVTVDTTAQYDAVRAYLKELDISSAVWVGLIRSNIDGDFTWTDYRGLSGDGYWSSAPDSRDAPLCAAADPAADYRWQARACGGPMIASFICELPVPQWALGSEGCMIRALPALTILYLPESASVQLTADCGMAGVKKVQCTGKLKHEDLIKDLSCFQYAEDEIANSTTSVWSTPLDTESEDLKDALTTEETMVTDNDNIEQTVVTSKLLIKPTIARPLKAEINKNNVEIKNVNILNIKPINKNINIDVVHNNNLQSNDIPKLLSEDDLKLNEQYSKSDDELIVQHRMLHDELARRGNFETIFSQPTDHFIPPLVMAKAKLNNDMNVMSLEEKHANQLKEQRNHGLTNTDNKPDYLKKIDYSHGKFESNDKINRGIHTYIPTYGPPTTTADVKVDDKNVINKNSKYIPAKKYAGKTYDIKSKTGKYLDSRPKLSNKGFDVDKLLSTTATNILELNTEVQYSNTNDTNSDDSTIDLKVIFKEPIDTEKPLLGTLSNPVSTNSASITSKPSASNKDTIEHTVNNVTESDEEINEHRIVHVKIPNPHDATATPTTFEFTTKIHNTNNQSTIKLTSENKMLPLSVGISNEFVKSTTEVLAHNDLILNDTNIIKNYEVSKMINLSHIESTSIKPNLNSQTRQIPDDATTIKPNLRNQTRKLPDEITTIKPNVNIEMRQILDEVTIKPNLNNQTRQIPDDAITIKPNLNMEIPEISNRVQTMPPKQESINTMNLPTSTIVSILNNKLKSYDIAVNTTTVTIDSHPNQNSPVDSNTDSSSEDVYVSDSTDTPVTIDDFQSPLLSGANDPLPKPNRSRRPQPPPPNRNKFIPFRMIG